MAQPSRDFRGSYCQIQIVSTAVRTRAFSPMHVSTGLRVAHYSAGMTFAPLSPSPLMPPARHWASRVVAGAIF